MAAMQKSIILQDNMSSVFNYITQSMLALENQFDITRKTVEKGVDVSAWGSVKTNISMSTLELSQAMSSMDITEANDAYQRLNCIIDSTNISIRGNIDAQSGFNQSVGSGKNITTALGGALKNIAKSAVEAFDVQKVMALADAYTQTSARLETVNYGFDSTSQLQDKVFASAQRARVSYQMLTDSVSQMGLQARSAFSGNDELIAFNEQLNKNFAIAGIPPQDMQASTSQLAQVMANGVMSGDELNSVFGQTPAVIQIIADYMQVPTRELQNMAAQGLITSDVIKNSLLSASEETNQKFADMPVTFQQMGTVVKDALVQAFQPVLQAIAQGAVWIYENWSTIAPVFYGVAAGALVLAAVLGIQALATFLASGALQGLFTTLMANPLTWIILAIGLVVGMIYSWIQSVGGIKIAWLICMNEILTRFDMFKIGFGVIWSSVLNGIDSMIYGFEGLKAGVLNALGNLKIMGLTILQDFINGAIDNINKLIEMVNLVGGTSIELIAPVEFATKAAIEEQENQRQRNVELEALKTSNEERKNARKEALYEDILQSNRARMEREAEIRTLQNDAALNAAEQDSVPGFSGAGDPISGTGVNDGASTAANTGNTASNTAAMANAMDIMEEDLKYMRDAAEQEIINRFTLAELKVDMTNNNTLKTETDFDRMTGMIAEVTSQILASSAEGGHL